MLTDPGATIDDLCELAGIDVWDTLDGATVVTDLADEDVDEAKVKIKDPRELAATEEMGGDIIEEMDLTDEPTGEVKDKTDNLCELPVIEMLENASEG